MSTLAWTGFAMLGWAIVPAVLPVRIETGFRALALWSFAGVAVAAPGLRRAIAGGYRSDSLFSLEPFQRAVVVAIATALILTGFWLAYRFARALSRKPRSTAARLAALAANLIVALGVYSAAYVVSPQVFYTYYRTIFAGLPDQWVVRTGYQLEHLAGALQLAGDANMALDAAGVCFWALAALTVSVHARAWGSDSS